MGTQVTLILSTAISLDGKVKRPGDQVKVSNALAETLITNGRAKLATKPTAQAPEQTTQEIGKAKTTGKDSASPNEKKVD